MTVTARTLAEAPDHEIVAAVVGGERAAFELLVRRHNQRLYRAARAIVHDDNEAEDHSGRGGSGGDDSAQVDDDHSGHRELLRLGIGHAQGGERHACRNDDSKSFAHGV